MRRILLSALALVLMAGCSTKQTVVVYSPHGPEMLKDAEARFEAANPGVDVQWLDLPSQEVYNRIGAERGRPHADIWWGATSSMFIQAANEDLLEAYKPTWASAVEAAYKDPQDRWYGMFRSPLAILFNTRKYTKEQVPQTWDALLDPQWKGKITLREPLPSGTLRVFIGAMILRAPNEDAGIDWLKRLHTQTESYMEQPQLLFDHIKRNPELISVWLAPDAVLQRELNGYPFDYVIPAGTPVTTDGIAVVKNAPHPELARKFYEFVTSPEMLSHQAQKFGKMPARNDLDPKSLPAWMVQEKIDPMPIDWQQFSAKEGDWMNRWAREVRGSR
jgi:iron(III) transport system substrate-binding protein